MNLYFAYRGKYGSINGYNVREALRAANRDYVLSNIKIVACPFCGVSTSNGEVITVTKCGYYLLLRCLTCQKAAFSKQHSQLVTKEEIEKLHPHNVIADDVTFYLASLHEINSVSCTALRQFSSTKDIPNYDVIAFYSDLEKFGDENKININCDIDKDIAAKFLKDNDLAKKYKIEYIGDNYGNYLELHINDYSLTYIPIHSTIDVTLTKDHYSMVTYINELTF